MEGNKKVLTLLLPLYYKSDWLRQQILWNLRKAAFIFILCFLDNFLISKSWLSLSNTETLCEEHVNLLTFLGYCLQVLWLVEILITHTHTHTHTKRFENGVWIHLLFRKRPFCSYKHSLCENENISMQGKCIAPYVLL